MEGLANITLLALVDSINPCTLAVQSMLLASIILKYDKRRAIISGLLFSFTVFIAYFLYGLGVLKIVSFFSSFLLRVLINLLLIVMVLAEINGYLGAKGLKAMEMPMPLRKHARKALSKTTSYVMVILVAFLMSIFLLPCSSGPYITALSMLNQLSIKSFLVLMYYNFIFILPMLLITFLVGYGTSPKAVMKWKEKHIKHLHLISAILLLTVLVYYNLSFSSGYSQAEGSVLYVISSPTCPHCINLKNHLQSFDFVNISYISPTSPLASKIKQLLPKWSGGVPLVVCVTDKEIYAMIGYPSASQENNGYFMGEEKEKDICRSQGGKEVYENSVYRYCILPNGFIMGNKYALNMILDIYQKEGCKDLVNGN